jgi:hypothetical protein
MLRYVLGVAAAAGLAAVAAWIGYDVGRRAAVDRQLEQHERTVLARLDTLDGKVEDQIAAQASLREQMAAIAAPRNGAGAAPSSCICDTKAAAAPQAAAVHDGSRELDAVRAERDGLALLEGASRAKRWTQEDRDHLRALFRGTDDEGKRRLAGALNEALISQGMSLDGLHGPPF